MKNSNKIKKMLNPDKKILELKINDEKKFNFYRNLSVSFFKISLVTDKVLPYIISSIIISSFQTNAPFIYDDVLVHSTIETIDTSTNEHFEKELTESDHHENELKKSTSWNINENNLYEREVTYYQVPNNINLDDLESVFNLTQEEIDSLLINNIEIVMKSSLSEEDRIYNQDMFIVTHYKEGPLVTVKESKLSNLTNTAFFLIVSCILGKSLKLLKKALTQERFKNLLEDKIDFYDYLQDCSREEAEEIKKLRERNEELLNEKKYTYKSRGGIYE